MTDLRALAERARAMRTKDFSGDFNPWTEATSIEQLAFLGAVRPPAILALLDERDRAERTHEAEREMANRTAKAFVDVDAALRSERDRLREALRELADAVENYEPHIDHEVGAPAEDLYEAFNAALAALDHPEAERPK